MIRRNAMKKNILFILTATFLVMVLTEQLIGMPAFARKYKMSCNVCHNPFPHLKPYGEEFAGNGFKLADKDVPRYVQETGDDRLSLIRNLPIAVRFEGHVYYNNANSRQLDFVSPYLIKLLSGGTLSKNISYYFYFFLGELGKVAGLEDAFVMFSDVFGSGISASLGQFQVSDPLFKRELRLTFVDYEIYKVRSEFSAIDLTYDRGMMLNFGFKTGTDFTIEILNGSGIDPADPFENFDSDKYKNLFGRVLQGIGEHFTIGGCAYYGKETSDVGDGVNRVWIWGVDASLRFPVVEFRFQVMGRNDSNPTFLAPENGFETDIHGGFAEMVLTPRRDKSLVYVVMLYNWVNYGNSELNYRSLSAHLGFLLRRNLRLVGELNYIFRSPLGEYARAGVGLVTAF
jgi:hypothetical protein